MRTFGRSAVNEDGRTVNKVTSSESIAGDKMIEINADGVKIK